MKNGMQTFFAVVIPPLIVVVAFLYGGTAWGYTALALVALYLIYKRFPDFLMLAANRKLKKGDTEGALAYMERVLKTGRMSYNYKLYYAYSCLRAGKMKKAERLFNMVIHGKAPENLVLDAKSAYSMFLWKGGKLDEAIAMIEPVYEKVKNTSVYGRLGFFYLEAGETDKALAFNQEAYDFNGNDPSIADNLALCYYKKGDYDKALALYEGIVNEKLTLPVVYYNYALTLEAVGQTEKAIAMIEKALTFRFSSLASVSLKTMEEKLDELRKQCE